MEFTSCVCRVSYFQVKQFNVPSVVPDLRASRRIRCIGFESGIRSRHHQGRLRVFPCTAGDAATANSFNLGTANKGRSRHAAVRQARPAVIAPQRGEFGKAGRQHYAEEVACVVDRRYRHVDYEPASRRPLPHHESEASAQTKACMCDPGPP